MDYMIINGFNTSTLPGCVVTDFGDVEVAKPKGDVTKLYGVNGNYRVLDGSYESYERTFKFYISKQVDIATAMQKFQSNDNVLEFSYQLGSIFYANFLSASYKPSGHHGWELSVKLDMQPFRYPKDVEPVVLTSAGTIENIGTVYSEPIIEILGDGNVSLTIGRETMHLSIIGKSTIDCRQGKQNIFNARGEVKNTLRNRGGFFEIPVGLNGVTYTGDVRQVTIRPNWRYLV